MEFDWIWKAVLIVIVGTFLLRVAGRKSISQMTLAQTIIMIAIGSLLIQPVAGKNIWTTFGVGVILILTLKVMEYVQVLTDGAETAITGKSKIIIENGAIHKQNLKKLRLTVDQLEMNLRQQNISHISDVKWATLEPNGQVGYELKQEAQSVKVKDFHRLQQDIQQIKQILHANFETPPPQPVDKKNIFAEVKEKHHEGQIPKNLQ